MFDSLQTARRAVTRHARAAARAGFDAHEQALTEIVLTRAAPPARVVTFTQREEARTGADWLWWWRGSSEWFGAIVQAKRNKPRQGLPWYDFDYRSRDGSRQVDRLLEAARHLAVPALYVLYNEPGIPSTCPAGSPCCIAGSESWRRRLRVAVLPALVAGWLADFADTAPQFSRPLECIACHVPGSVSPHPIFDRRPNIHDPALRSFLEDENPADPARRVARMMMAQVEAARSGQFRSYTWEVGEALDSTPDRVFTEFPDDPGHFAEPYFEHVLRGLRRRPPWYVSDLLDEASPERVGADLPGVAGVVIIDRPS